MHHVASYIDFFCLFIFYNAKKAILNIIVYENYIFTEFIKGLYFVAEGVQEEK